MHSQKEIDKIMLIIPVKDGESIERALKKYKRKFDKTGVVRQLRARQQFTKPSVTKRQQISRAIYKQAIVSQEEA
ncbi:SSU ribosomal protein S21P [Chishuiella changwenlii]|uniref:Small ribosomal subunit protein bS21 n=2 Tax=Chishuiella changwenlii TaxID=1434701 RepID=A0A1M6SN12_9FLAO|nr:30S ribosomal protein S21 [Chishuiella changwenlii]SHK46122.1 SSU ribosomal protein S21P [Chishuiella changwenlii]